jgi:hypothetical protein
VIREHPLQKASCDLLNEQALDGSVIVKNVVRGSDAEKCGLIRKGDILFEVSLCIPYIKIFQSSHAICRAQFPALVA